MTIAVIVFAVLPSLIIGVWIYLDPTALRKRLLWGLFYLGAAVYYAGFYWCLAWASAPPFLAVGYPFYDMGNVAPPPFRQTDARYEQSLFAPRRRIEETLAETFTANFRQSLEKTPLDMQDGKGEFEKIAVRINDMSRRANGFPSMDVAISIVFHVTAGPTIAMHSAAMVDTAPQIIWRKLGEEHPRMGWMGPIWLSFTFSSGQSDADTRALARLFPEGASFERDGQLIGELHFEGKSILRDIEQYVRIATGFPDVSSPSHAFRCLYLSVVTITTLGYGDIVPLSEAARLGVAIEAVCGLVIIGLFVNAVWSHRTVVEVAGPGNHVAPIIGQLNELEAKIEQLPKPEGITREQFESLDRKVADICDQLKRLKSKEGD